MLLRVAEAVAEVVVMLLSAAKAAAEVVVGSNWQQCFLFV